MWLQGNEFVEKYIVLTDTMLKIYEDKETYEGMPEEVLVQIPLKALECLSEEFDYKNLNIDSEEEEEPLH